MKARISLLGVGASIVLGAPLVLAQPYYYPIPGGSEFGPYTTNGLAPVPGLTYEKTPNTVVDIEGLADKADDGRGQSSDGQPPSAMPSAAGAEHPLPSRNHDPVFLPGP